MQHQESNGIGRETFINIRKLAALDIVFHGSRFILAEFIVAVVVPGFVGALALLVFFNNPSHPFAQVFLGASSRG